MRLFYYRFIGSGNAYGPVRATDERDARRKIRDTFINRRTRFEVWETSQQSIDAIAADNRRNYHPMYGAE